MDDKIKILVDETSDGMDLALQRAGYYAESVKKLKVKDEKLAHDYNVMEYARKNDMVLITKDKEHGEACHDNGIKCILLSDDLIFERVILPELAKLSS